MTPIKPLVMIKRSLEKAFMCKSQFMIMIHSEWCLLLFTCLLWDEPAIYFGFRSGGASKNGKKTKIMHKKRRRKHWYIRKHEKTFMQVSPLISGICTGNVRKEILISLMLFEWKVLNRHCSHCRFSVNLQWNDFQLKPWLNSICFGSESK